MKQDWVKIFSSSFLHKAEILKSILEGQNIVSVILDKNDSSFKVFGQYELYVRNEDAEAAQKISSEAEL